MQKSKQRESSQTPNEPSLESGHLIEFDGEILQVVAATWKRELRSFEVTFGGVSMIPTIAPGEPVRLVCGPAPPGLGTVIAFIYQGRLAVHRLIAQSADGQWLVTRGDAHFLPDPPVRSTAVIGVVEATRSYAESGRRGVIARWAAILLNMSPRLYQGCIFILGSARNATARIFRWLR
jgi:hypothetical protein